MSNLGATVLSQSRTAEALRPLSRRKGGKVANGITETDFRRQVVELAKLRGWLVHHCRPAQDSQDRWATHIQGDTGFPDLVLVRLSRVLFCELKSEQGKVSPAQQTWLDALELTGKAEVYTWRPDDWNRIEEVLR